VYLEICANYRYGHVGQGGFPHRRVWLRLERQGAQIRGLCSADGQQWWTCGAGALPLGGPAQVGLYCITLGAGGAAAFEQFTVWCGAV
jgi:hypothetical protein